MHDIDPNLDFSQAFYQRLLGRKDESPDTSYTAKLLSDGLDKILKKIGEESVEVLLAAKSEDKNALLNDLADLYYHVMVLLVSKNIPPDEIKNVLSRRFAKSGIQEKASRVAG